MDTNDNYCGGDNADTDGDSNVSVDRDKNDGDSNDADGGSNDEGSDNADGDAKDGRDDCDDKDDIDFEDNYGVRGEFLQSNSDVNLSYPGSIRYK